MRGTQEASIKITGLFDSGVGGLSVLRQLRKVPNLSGDPALKDGVSVGRHEFLYLADTARCPYGNRAEQEISTFACEILSWFAERGVNQVIMACNTSAAVLSTDVREQFGLLIYDLIATTGRAVASLNVRTAVLATSATVRSHAFLQAICRYNSSAQVVEIACPELVPLVEAGLANHGETLDVLRKYVRQLSHHNVGAVVLGCTHYPFLREPLRQMLSPGVTIIDPAEELMKEMANGQGFSVSGEPDSLVPRVLAQTTMFVTGCPNKFQATAEICLGSSLGIVNGITVDDLKSAHAKRQTDLVASNTAIAPAVGAAEQLSYPA